MKLPKKITSFMLDLDGTLLGGHRPLPGALDFLTTLKRGGFQRLFVTNNSSRSVSSWGLEFRKHKIESHPHEIVTSGTATAQYLKENRLTKKVMLLGTSSLKSEFRRNGIQLAESREKPQAVVLAFDKSFNYPKMAQACSALFSGVPFIATHPDPVCPSHSHPIPDCGSMIAFLTTATGRAPVIIGKPFQNMARHSLERLGTKPSQIAMVGDRLETDIIFGKNAGCFTIWINSQIKKKTRAQSEIPKAPIVPDLEVASIGELIDMLP